RPAGSVPSGLVHDEEPGGEPEPERGSLARPPLGVQRAAVAFQDAPADGEAETVTFDTRLREALAPREQAPGLVGRKAASVVLHADLDRVAARMSDGDPERYAVAAVLDRVLEQVREQLSHLLRLDPKQRERIHLERGVRGLERRLQGVRHLANHP